MDNLGVILRLGGGHVVDELAAAILRVSEEVTATGNPGKVTLTLTIDRPKGADPAVVTVNEAIGVTLPKSTSLGALFFAVDGGLHQRDPRQPELSMRVIDGGVTTKEGQQGEIVREA